jgi:single-strand DNA-binding protein
MANLNRVFLIGNLTRDPELRYIPGGAAVSNLRLAINRRYRDQSGELKDITCFITVVVWGKQAESCNEYLRKGSSIFVEGNLQSRSWEAQDGQKRNVIEVRAGRIQFLGSPAQKEKHSEEGEVVFEEEPEANREEKKNKRKDVQASQDDEVPF